MKTFVVIFSVVWSFCMFMHANRLTKFELYVLFGWNGIGTCEEIGSIVEEMSRR